MIRKLWRLYCLRNCVGSHATAVADWLNTQVPGAAEHLTGAVMNAAGISVADWFKIRLGVTSQKKEGRC
jgi:hypothetical protein